MFSTSIVGFAVVLIVVLIVAAARGFALKIAGVLCCSWRRRRRWRWW
jgi:hypothetical protein